MEEALIFGIIVGTLFATIVLTNAKGLISLISDVISAVFNFCWSIICVIFKILEIIVLAVVEIFKRILGVKEDDATTPNHIE